MTPAQQRQLQEVVQRGYDQERELADLKIQLGEQGKVTDSQELIIKLQAKSLQDLKQSGGGQGPTQAQLDKQQLDVEAAQLNLRAGELKMQADQFKFEREKLEADKEDRSDKLSPKVILAAICTCLVLGLGGMVAKLG